MWRSLRWECNDIVIQFEDTCDAKVFMDFGSFNPAATAGVFDKRTAPGIDGVTTYSASLSELQPHIEARVLGYNMGSRNKSVERVLDEYVSLLCDAFNPRSAGRLYYTTNNGSYFIDARAVSLPAFGAITGGTLPFSVDLYADTPYWFNCAEYAVDMGLTRAMIETPLEAPGISGEIISARTTIPNYTHCDIYPVIRFWPNAVYPTLENITTGKKLSINERVSDGYYVEVDTTPLRSSVHTWRYNETTGRYEDRGNSSHWITLDSDIDFHIVPGENDLMVRNIVAGNSPAVSVRWRERAPGV